MKITQTISFFAIALCIGFLAARLSNAESTGKAAGKKLTTTNNDIDVQELESLENYLNDTKQTNALKELNDLLTDNRAWNDAVDLSFTIGILQGLRDGKTNEMLKFFESHLDSKIGLFGSEYHALPVSLQKQMNLKSLQRARDYRAKYPFNNPDQVWEMEVTNAFRILDKKN